MCSDLNWQTEIQLLNLLNTFKNLIVLHWHMWWSLFCFVFCLFLGFFPSPGMATWFYWESTCRMKKPVHCTTLLFVSNNMSWIMNMCVIREWRISCGESLERLIPYSALPLSPRQSVMLMRQEIHPPCVPQSNLKWARWSHGCNRPTGSQVST